MILSDGSARLVEVVEPTLSSEAGHCFALFRSLHSASGELSFRLWVDRGARVPAMPRERVSLERHFDRLWRKPQAWWLYRRLLRAGRPILVPTAGWFDLRALDLAAGGPIPPGRAFLYFHKWRAGAERALALAGLARRQPHLELFGTSPEIVGRLREAGFAHVDLVTPVLAAGSPGGAAAGRVPFRHLLSAGAARADKGFGRIVDLVARLAEQGADLPILVQASGDHYGRFDERTAADLARLRNFSYAPLVLREDTIDAAGYAALFPGAVCLQPYEAAEYADKMSSITFDALRAGAPVITVEGTSMARIVHETGAGMVLERADAAELERAARAAIRYYDRLQEKALAAAERYRPQSSWAPLVARLLAGGT